MTETGTGLGMVDTWLWRWPRLRRCRPGGLSTRIMILMLIRAYETAPAGLVAPFMYIEFVWSVALGLAVFGFLPDGWTLAAAATIIASGLYIRHRERSAPCSSD